MALPEARDDLIRTYSLNEQDVALVQRRRGSANRLGFAALLAYMRYPGIALGPDETPASAILEILAEQLAVAPKAWVDYARRSTTRREHLIELRSAFGFQTFDKSHYRRSVDHLAERAGETDKGLLLATELLRFLRNQHVLLPTMDVIERICAEAIARAVKRVNLSLTKTLRAGHRRRLDNLLEIRADTPHSVLSWLRQSPSAPSARHLLEHIQRLKTIEAIELPAGLDRQIHPNRLLKLAREGAQMTPQHLADLEATRRYATLVATVLESKATVIDELVDWHDRMIGRMFNRAKRTHDDRFTSSGKAINEKVRLFGRIGASLLEARETGADAFDAIEMVLPWSDFARSVQEAQLLAEPATFDYLDLIGGGYSQIHRYAPALLDALCQ